MYCLKSWFVRGSHNSAHVAFSWSQQGMVPDKTTSHCHSKLLPCNWWNCNCWELRDFVSDALVNQSSRGCDGHCWSASISSCVSCCSGGCCGFPVKVCLASAHSNQRMLRAVFVCRVGRQCVEVGWNEPIHSSWSQVGVSESWSLVAVMQSELGGMLEQWMPEWSLIGVLHG